MPHYICVSYNVVTFAIGYVMANIYEGTHGLKNESNERRIACS